MLNLLDNLEHVNIVDRWNQVCKNNNYKLDLNYAESFVKKHLFPEYRKDPDLKAKLKTIFDCA